MGAALLRSGVKKLGAIVPWVTRLDDDTLRAVAGPDMVVLRTPVRLSGQNMRTVGEFEVAGGETVPQCVASHTRFAQRSAGTRTALGIASISGNFCFGRHDANTLAAARSCGLRQLGASVCGVYGIAVTDAEVYSIGADRFQRIDELIDAQGF